MPFTYPIAPVVAPVDVIRSEQAYAQSDAMNARLKLGPPPMNTEGKFATRMDSILLSLGTDDHKLWKELYREGRVIETELRTLHAEHINLIFERGNLEKQFIDAMKERDELQRWKTGKANIAQSISQMINANICRPQDRPQGFTLVELLTVVAILAILFCVIAPAVSRSIRHARASIANTRQFHADRLGYAWDGDCTNQIFSCHNYNEMTNTTEAP